MRGVIVTRPEPGLSETLSMVNDLGWQSLAEPMLEVTAANFSPTRVFPKARAIILTSGQAVGFLPRTIERDVLVFAVGDRTAQRARDAGFTYVVSAQGDAENLVAVIMATITPTKGTSLLLLCGSGHALAVAKTLRANGFRINRRVVYDVRRRKMLSAQAEHELNSGTVAAVLFFSAETARAFTEAVPVGLRKHLAVVRAIAISPKVAAASGEGIWRSVETATHPSAIGVLECLGRYAQQ